MCLWTQANVDPHPTQQTCQQTSPKLRLPRPSDICTLMLHAAVSIPDVVCLRLLSVCLSRLAQLTRRCDSSICYGPSCLAHFCPRCCEHPSTCPDPIFAPTCVPTFVIIHRLTLDPMCVPTCVFPTSAPISMTICHLLLESNFCTKCCFSNFRDRPSPCSGSNVCTNLCFSELLSQISWQPVILFWIHFLHQVLLFQPL